MAVVPICSNIFCKDHARTIKNLIRQCGRGTTDDSIVIHKVSRCFCSSIAGDMGRRWHAIEHTCELSLKENTREGTYAFYKIRRQRPMTFQAVIGESVAHMVYGMDSSVKSSSRNTSQKDGPCMESNVSEKSTNERQLKALESYFIKLQNEATGQQSSCMLEKGCATAPKTKEYQTELSSSQLPEKMIKSVERSNQLKIKEEIGSLDDYFDKLNTGANSQKEKSSCFDDETKGRNLTRIPFSVSGEHNKSSEESTNKLKKHMLLQIKEDENGSLPFGEENFQDLQPGDEASDLYLISILASINIGVFLFEIASPVRNSDFEKLSLPLIYGAKINQLILSGEWWRLVTPMFLHSGFLHVALGCWVLLTFGPQVCRGYGPFTFFLIYILGGIAGNLSSFLHTPEATVGGTGPVFAILGAWFIYYIQNKEISAKEAENVFQKAVIVTGLSFILNNFERIDDWTHLGAACAGLLFGFLTCPTLELDDASSKNGQEKGITLIRRQADPCKSLAIFIVFILIVSSLVFLVEPELNSLELDSFI